MVEDTATIGLNHGGGGCRENELCPLRQRFLEVSSRPENGLIPDIFDKTVDDRGIEQFADAESCFLLILSPDHSAGCRLAA